MEMLENLSLGELKGLNKKLKSLDEKPKSYFYGINGIEFEWNGSWSDPYVIYNNYVFNYFDLEEPLYSMYEDDKYEKEIPLELSFEDWLKDRDVLAFDVLNDLILDKCYKKRRD